MAFINNWVLLLLALISIIISVNSKVDNSAKNHTQSWSRSDFEKEYENVEINRFCDINDNCTHSMLCIDSRCWCPPNHKWDYVNKECQSFNCKTNETECRVSDPHRVCRRISLNHFSGLFYGECECRHGYHEDSRNQKCRKMCQNNRDCDPGLAFGGPTNNMVCVDVLCQCRPNFRWNITTNSCEAFNCTKDADCWTGVNENRECYNGEDSNITFRFSLI